MISGAEWTPLDGFDIFAAMTLSNSRARAILVFLLAILLIWLRAPDRILQGFLWAEDSREFMFQAHRLGKHSLFLDYSGYLHLLPRLIAYAQFMLTPVHVAPYLFAITCLLLTAAACGYIASVIRPPALAISMGLAPIISPQGGEVLLSIANLQWMMFPLLLVLLWQCLFDPPDSWVWPRVGLTAVLVMTGPFGVLLLPIALLAAIWRRAGLSRLQLAWLVVYLIAALFQAWIMHTHPAYTPPPGRVDWINRAPKELFADLASEDASLWVGCLIAAWLIVIIAFSDSALIGAFICVVGIAIWALGAYKNNGITSSFIWYGAGGRYLYIPLLMFLWSALLAAATARNRTIFAASMLFAGLILYASTTHFKAGVWKPWSIAETPTTYELLTPPDWAVSIPK